MRCHTKTFHPVLCVILSLLTVPVFAARNKPNVVYIMADELGYYELSHMGHPHIKTPQIDRFAAEGIRFTHGLAGSSLCAPTRGVLMTGKHSGHTSVRTNGGGTPLRAGEATVASVLKSAGYATGGFGKWGCGGRGSTGVPEKHGFDRFVGYYDQVHAHSYYPKYIIDNSKEMVLEGNRGGSDGKTYSHYVIVDEAKKFIRTNKDKPFFCYLPITPPHGIFDIPDEDPAWALYKDKDWPEQAKRYAAMVSMVDRQVGEVLALLRELGLEKDTLVFFCGDNGGNDYFKSKDHPRGFHGPNVDPKTGVAFRGTKGTLYEGGLRIPMLARWPGRISPGVSHHRWYFPDVLPTLAELAGANPPADIDGVSILPTLIGAEAAGRPQEQHEFLYWELGQRTAVRMHDWKLHRGGKNRAWELYDLKTDPSETKDVAAAHPKIVARMSGFAARAHTPAVEGEFGDRTLHERDRAAKFGDTRPPQRSRGRAHRLTKKNLVKRKNYKLVRTSSESASNNRLAKHAFDGNPRTHWHTRFGDEIAKPPHELVIDLGATHTISGFRYLARQDGGWNGAVAKCAFFVSDSPEAFGETPAAAATFTKSRTSQEAKCTPTRGRYVLFRVLSSADDGPWASVAEFGVLRTKK